MKLQIVTRLKKKIEKTQLEKVHFIKVNELKLAQIELLSFFHFKCVTPNAFELFCMAHFANSESFLYHPNV